MIRLTDKEILEIRSSWLTTDCLDEETATEIALTRLREMNKVQLKKFVEWGDEECTEHHAYHTPKHQCVQCMSSMWQSLLEEVK